MRDECDTGPSWSLFEKKRLVFLPIADSAAVVGHHRAVMHFSIERSLELRLDCYWCCVLHSYLPQQVDICFPTCSDSRTL